MLVKHLKFGKKEGIIKNEERGSSQPQKAEPLARCSQVGAITIITAAAGGWVITIIIAAIITIITAIVGNNGKDGNGKIAIHCDKQ